MKGALLDIWYVLWRITASLGLKMYFSSLQVNGLDKVPAKGPIILAVNHQNSFLDAIIVACVLRRKSYFLARGDVFRKRWAYSMLSSLGIMPIFRTRDGIGKVRDNKGIFDSCSRILAKGGAVMIFPEGNHYMRWSLRPLQRGIARIAFQSLEVNREPLKIVPIGLQFEDHMKAASRILVNIGSPLDVEMYAAMENEDQRMKMDLLIHDLFHALKNLILDIPEEGYEEFVEKMKAARSYKSDLVEQLKTDQQIINSLVNNEPVEINSPNDKAPVFRYLIYLLVPLGWVTHFIPRSIISTIVKVKVNDPQFIAPLNFALGLVIYPLNAIIWGALVAAFSKIYFGLLTVGIVLLAGKLTLRYWH